MYSRSNSVTLTVPRQESFGFTRMARRSTEPEFFTFERIPAQATAVRSFVPIRPKKRCTRVMYPAKVRMHLPPPERSQAKRWLVILCLVVLWQIYNEDPYAEAKLSGSDPASGGDLQAFSIQSAEEQARQLEASALLASSPSGCKDLSDSGEQPVIPGPTCPTPEQEPESSRAFEQSARNSYVVALLVYHRLGSDN